MAVLAGVLSAVGAFLLNRGTSDSYDEAIKLQLEQKALAYGQTATAFVNALGPDGLPLVQRLLQDALVDAQQPPDEPSLGSEPSLLENVFLGFEGWIVDPTAPGGLRLVFREIVDEGASSDEDPAARSLIEKTGTTNAPAAALDEDHRHIHVSVPINLDAQTRIIAVGTLSAEEEFAFFAHQRQSALRNGLLLSAGIIGFVSLVGTALGLVLSRHLTSRERAEAALREQARRDPLTGVLNHAAIVAELKSLLARDVNHAPCAVAMVDVDGMKATNDTYGHQVGDQVLVAVSQALSADGAILGRYGGDEFVAILEGADRNAAQRYRDGVVRRLRQTSIIDPESGLTVPLSIGMGLAVYPEEAETVMDLIKLADDAMYASRLRRPLPPSGKGMPRRRDEGATRMVGEMVPLLTSEGDLTDKLRLVAHRLSVAAEYDGVNFELLTPDTHELLAASSFGHVSDEQLAAWETHERRQGPNALTPILARTLRPVIISDTDEDQRISEEGRELLRQAGFRSILAAPMLWQDQLIGILSVLSKRASAFGPRDAQLLTAVATQVAAIVRMETLVQELQSTSSRLARAQEETVMLLAATAEVYDASIPLHFRGVRSLSEALARELGWDDERASELGLAAALHDIGKIRVPQSVLLKPGELNDEDWELMKQHTIWGADLLAGRVGFELAETIARHHHERWDGSGYPDGLAGEAIPEADAIVAVADAFDAMTSERSYHRPRSVDAAVQEVVERSGEQFSPQVVEALVRLHRRRELPSITLEDWHEKAAVA